MKTIKFYLVLLFTACTLLVNAQTPEAILPIMPGAPLQGISLLYAACRRSTLSVLPASRRILQETELR